MGLKVLLLACRKTGLNALQAILTKGRHVPVGVVSQDYPDLVNDGVVALDYRRLAESNGVLFWQTDRIHEPEFIAKIAGLKPDVGLSVGWRRLVKEPLISIPRLGFVNFHTSDLPKYRGFASTSWAILRGESSVAVTAHRMVSGKADQGDILLKRHIPLDAATNISDLFKQVEAIIPGMIQELLDAMEEGTMPAVPQNESRALLSYPRKPSDGWIDWTQGALDIDRLVRSVSRPYPGAFTCWNLCKVIVWRGHVHPDSMPFAGVPGHVIGTDDGRSLKVLTGSGIFCIDEIQIENEPVCRMPASVIKGMQQRLGLSPGELFEHLRRLCNGSEEQR